jgi:hypothetical protein
MLDDLNEATPVLPYAAVYGDILRLIIQRYIAGRLHNLKVLRRLSATLLTSM